MNNLREIKLRAKDLEKLGVEIVFVNHPSDHMIALSNAKLIAAAPELLDALILLSTNKHFNLSDAIYSVRESEGDGWEGESVKAWSNAVDKVRLAIEKAIK